MAYELMNTMYPDASTWYTSLDKEYFYEGQVRKLKEAILPHHAYGSNEIDLQIGDEITVTNNRWNGYTRGKNLRTGKAGLYPTFKVLIFDYTIF